MLEEQENCHVYLFFLHFLRSCTVMYYETSRGTGEGEQPSNRAPTKVVDYDIIVICASVNFVTYM